MSAGATTMRGGAERRAGAHLAKSSDPMIDAGEPSTETSKGANQSVVLGPPGVVMVAAQTAPHNALAVKAA